VAFVGCFCAALAGIADDLPFFRSVYSNARCQTRFDPFFEVPQALSQAAAASDDVAVELAGGAGGAAAAEIGLSATSGASPALVAFSRPDALGTRGLAALGTGLQVPAARLDGPRRASPELGGPGLRSGLRERLDDELSTSESAGAAIQRQLRYSTYELESLEAPDVSLQPFHRGSLDSFPYDPFRIDLDLSRRPEYLPPEDYEPLIDVRPREPSRRNQAIQQLLEKELYRQMRRLLKRQWRKQFQEDVSMTQSFYQERLSKIHQIGKSPEEFDPANIDYYYNQTRNDALRRAGNEGEKELVLLEWGAFKIDDNGSLSLDLKSIFKPEKKSQELLIGPQDEFDGDGIKGKPLISGKYYRVNTRFKVNFNPFRALRENDVQETVTSYGGVVEIDFLSDILKRRLFTTEFEAELDRDGRWGVFFNIVLTSRR
jgi:hypothetical protein